MSKFSDIENEKVVKNHCLSQMKYVPESVADGEIFRKMTGGDSLSDGHVAMYRPDDWRGLFVLMGVRYGEDWYRGVDWLKFLNEGGIDGKVSVKQMELIAPWIDPKKQKFKCEAFGYDSEQAEKNVRNNTASKPDDNQRCYAGYKRHKANTVVIVGAGHSSYTEAEEVMRLRGQENVKIITMSTSQNRVEGDYYLGSDPQDFAGELVKDSKTSDTILAMSILAHPNYKRHGWKEILYYTNTSRSMDGIMEFFPRLSVSYAAFQFAIRVLQASDIILVGCDCCADVDGKLHPTGNKLERPDTVTLADGRKVWTTPGYMSMGFTLEGMALMCRHVGIHVWNASKGGIPLRNMANIDMKKFADLYLKTVKEQGNDTDGNQSGNIQVA